MSIFKKYNKDDFLKIGLFGTCGDSKWRDAFMKAYDALNIKYYNPQVKDWKAELASIEASNLANDKIILFPITSETYGTGSLSEIGFSILNAIKLDDRRDFVILIDDHLDEKLITENKELAKESLRARALIAEHLKELNLSNIYIADTLEDMLKISVTLYHSNEIRSELDDYSLTNYK